MVLLGKTQYDADSEQFVQLIHVIRDDSEINKRVIRLLKLDSYQRRNVLNRWLEQLRRKSASDKLMQTLTYLFDDNIAKKVLTLITKRQTLNNII